MRAAAGSSPIHAVINVMRKYLGVTHRITMTGLQAQGLGYTKDVYRVPLSIKTYDSVIKVHGMVLASFPGHFPPPTRPRSL